MTVVIDRLGRAHAGAGGHDGYDPGEFLPSHDEVSPRATRRLSGCAMLQRALDAGLSRHQGCVGKRISAILRVAAVYESMGFYGPSYFTVARDEVGSVYVSRTTKPWASRGDVLAISAFVKAHGDYQGTAQTEINRVRLQSGL